MFAQTYHCWNMSLSRIHLLGVLFHRSHQCPHGQPFHLLGTAERPHPESQVLPHGIELTKYHPAVRPLQLPNSKSSVFLFNGGLLPRKGIDILLQVGCDSKISFSPSAISLLAQQQPFAYAWVHVHVHMPMWLAHQGGEGLFLLSNYIWTQMLCTA